VAKAVAWTDLPVEGVAGFQYHFFAFGNFPDGPDIGMVTVVAAVRLGARGLFRSMRTACIIRAPSGE
jgi:hypothetical protein